MAMRLLMCLSTVVFLIGCATQSSKSTEDNAAAVDTARLMSSDEVGEARRGRLESSLSASKVAVGEAFYLEERFSNEGNRRCSILSTGVYSALERFCEESGDWEQVDIDPETLTCDPASGVAGFIPWPECPIVSEYEIENPSRERAEWRERSCVAYFPLFPGETLSVRQTLSINKPGRYRIYYFGTSWTTMPSPMEFEVVE